MFWGIWRKGAVVDSANAALQKGMELQSERDVRINETPSPVFFCVRSVIINSRLR